MKNLTLIFLALFAIYQIFAIPVDDGGISPYESLIENDLSEVELPEESKSSELSEGDNLSPEVGRKHHRHHHRPCKNLTDEQVERRHHRRCNFTQTEFEERRLRHGKDMATHRRYNDLEQGQNLTKEQLLERAFQRHLRRCNSTEGHSENGKYRHSRRNHFKRPEGKGSARRVEDASETTEGPL